MQPPCSSKCHHESSMMFGAAACTSQPSWEKVTVGERTAGVLQESAAVRLQHMCDAVISLEAVRDDSGVARMVSDGSRCSLSSTHAHCSRLRSEAG